MFAPCPESQHLSITEPELPPDQTVAHGQTNTPVLFPIPTVKTVIIER